MGQAGEEHNQQVNEALATKNSKQLWDIVEEMTNSESRKSLCRF